ncbi:MAG: hypothetical protein HY293_01580 [Planctomycetes bacterium]|nr:hypothetical protein [Planctomycetota bacterium]
MSVFRTLAYLSPLIVGFGLPAALALSSERPPKRRAIACGGVLTAVLGLLFLTSFAESPRLWGPLAFLLLSFAALVAGLYLLCESARAPRELSQIVAGLAVCFLMSTLFCFGPVIRSMADAGAGGEAISRRISLAMAVNPFFVMGYGIFRSDLLYLPVFYRTDLAGFQHENPSWPASSAGFLLAGLALAAASIGLRRVMKR